METDSTIELKIDFERITHGNGTELNKAIGRLSTWGYGSFNNVAIHNDGKEDLIAYYRKDTNTGQAGYVIGAVWRQGSNEYTFHS